MTGDERESDNDVGEPIGSNRPAPEPAGDTPRPRPFAAWSSAQPEEGVLEKIGKRISGMFARKPKSDDIETDAPIELQSAAPEPAELIDASAAAAPVEDFAPDVAPADASSMSDPISEPVVMWTPDFAPPETAPSSAPRTPIGTPVVETAPASDFGEPDTVVPLDQESGAEFVPATPEEPKRGFFSRLFGKKPKLEPEPVEATAMDDAPLVLEPVDDTPAIDAPAAEVEAPVADAGPLGQEVEAPVEEVEAAASQRLPWEDEELVRTDEHQVPAPEEIPVERTFASVEDALPVDAAGLSEDLELDATPDEAPKPGFFSRLFGRKSKSAPRPSLEIEVHEDRIEAAAHALDEVSGESFAAPVAGSDGDATESFASVDDALPVEPEPDTARAIGGAATEPFDVQALIGVQRTEAIDVASVPQADMRFAPPAPPAPPAGESRSTLEIEPYDPYSDRDPRETVETPQDSRSTLEMEHEPRSTEEIKLELEQRDFSDTLEVEEKTDEFQVPVLDVDVERKTDEFDQLEDEAGAAEELAPQTWWQKALRIKPKVVGKKKPLPAGTVVEGNPNFLFSKFRAFYNEIIRLKHQKTEFTAGFATAIVTDYTADLSPDAAAAAQSQALTQMLELQLAEANWMGGEARDRYPDAQYAMACLADEIFTHLEWDGQAAWRNHLLEIKLFKSRAADVEVFKRIDKLLKDKPNSHVARDLARVYLLVIAAGFQGKYRPFGLTRALAEYRQRLFEYIHQGDALMLYSPERRIFPDASARTLEGHAVARFSGAQRWAAILILIVLGYTALAHYAWNRVSADLKDVTERIRAASSTSAAPPAGQTTANSTRNGGAQ